MKIGDKVIVRRCQDDESRVGDVGSVIDVYRDGVLVSFPTKSKAGTGYPELGHQFCWCVDNENVELLPQRPRPDNTMRDVNGEPIAEGDKIVYVTRRGAWMQMIPAVVVKATSVDITVIRTGYLHHGQERERKIVLAEPAYIAITEKANA